METTTADNWYNIGYFAVMIFTGALAAWNARGLKSLSKLGIVTKEDVEGVVKDALNSHEKINNAVSHSLFVATIGGLTETLTSTQERLAEVIEMNKVQASQIEALRVQLNRLESELATVKDRLKKVTKERDDLQRERERLEREVEELRARLRVLEASS